MVKEKAKTLAKKETSITEYNESRLERNMGVGMSKVDPLDIRPPRILLIQKISDVSQFIDKDGKTPKPGQFFHTGKMEIFDSFDCYFLFAAKSRYIDRRREGEGEKDQYKALGWMSDGSLFAMTFRSSSLYTLSPLFSAVTSMKRPMYSFLVTIEKKELSGEKGDWFIPVLRITATEDDPEKLIFLEDQAKAFDSRADEVAQQDFEEEAPMPTEEEQEESN